MLMRPVVTAVMVVMAAVVAAVTAAVAAQYIMMADLAEMAAPMVAAVAAVERGQPITPKPGLAEMAEHMALTAEREQKKIRT